MSFRTRRNRGGKRRTFRGGACPYTDAAAAGSLSAASGGGRRSRRHRRRTKHAKSKKRRGGLSSQLLPWALIAGVLGLSKRKSRKHKRKSYRRRR